jgi:hypothetical protein
VVSILVLSRPVFANAGQPKFRVFSASEGLVITDLRWCEVGASPSCAYPAAASGHGTRR